MVIALSHGCSIPNYWASELTQCGKNLCPTETPPRCCRNRELRRTGCQRRLCPFGSSKFLLGTAGPGQALTDIPLIEVSLCAAMLKMTSFMAVRRMRNSELILSRQLDEFRRTYTPMHLHSRKDTDHSRHPRHLPHIPLTPPESQTPIDRPAFYHYRSLEFHINRIIPFAIFSVWLLLLSTPFSISICVVAHIRSSFPFHC